MQVFSLVLSFNHVNSMWSEVFIPALYYLNECVKDGSVVILHHFMEFGRITGSDGVTKIHPSAVVGVCPS